MAINSAVDIFALQLLQPNEFNGQISIGFLAAQNLQTFVWLEFAAPITLLQQGALYISSGIVVLAIVGWVSYRSNHINKAIKNSHKPSAYTPITSHDELWQLRSKPKWPTFWLRAALIMLLNWLRLAKLNRLILLIVFSWAIINPSALNVVIPLSLVMPLLLFSGNKMGLNHAVNAIELTTNALQRPTPMGLKILLLVFLIVVPLSPSLIYFDPWQLVSFISSTTAVTAWLLLAYYQLNRPMLGVAGYAAIWYVFAINQPPFDLFGLTPSAPHQLTSAVAISAVVVMALIGFIGRNKVQH
jgi:hypothetical protein